MKIIKLKLHPNYKRHVDHCQITYLARNNNGERIAYCLQDNGDKFGGIRLMRCSEDGEPSHECSFKTVRAEFEKPTGDSKLEKLCREWIENYERISK